MVSLSSIERYSGYRERLVVATDWGDNGNVCIYAEVNNGDISDGQKVTAVFENDDYSFTSVVESANRNLDFVTKVSVSSGASSRTKKRTAFTCGDLGSSMSMSSSKPRISSSNSGSLSSSTGASSSRAGAAGAQGNWKAGAILGGLISFSFLASLV